ncbi:MAG: GlsB/YeaQ/YmgE family stress response membrane protein [Candidatus Melainabacteria bacterium]|nr:GlsB/YeaQ/YmgE family stress response membrane protein [Candidatus Melainabacteria bacterium]
MSFLFYLLIAAICAIIAERIIPGSIPGGFITAIIFGVIGAWLGGILMGSFGPQLAGVALIPCIMGSGILVFTVSLFSNTFRNRKIV